MADWHIRSDNEHGDLYIERDAETPSILVMRGPLDTRKTTRVLAMRICSALNDCEVHVDDQTSLRRAEQPR